MAPRLVRKFTHDRDATCRSTPSTQPSIDSSARACSNPGSASQQLSAAAGAASSTDFGRQVWRRCVRPITPSRRWQTDYRAVCKRSHEPVLSAPARGLASDVALVRGVARLHRRRSRRGIRSAVGNNAGSSTRLVLVADGSMPGRRRPQPSALRRRSNNYREIQGCVRLPPTSAMRRE